VRETRPRRIGRGRALLFGLGLAVALTLALLPAFPRQLQVSEGDTASRTMKAPRDISYESQTLTEQRREEAADAVPDTVVFNANVRTQQVDRLDSVLAQVGQIRERADLTVAGKASALEGIHDLSLTQAGTSALLDLPNEQWPAVASEARTILGGLLSESISDAAVSATRDRVGERIDSSLTPDQALVVTELVRPLVTANLTIDQAKTEEAREAARAAVVPVRVSLGEGQTIVSKGDVIDAATLEQLDEAGLLSPAFDWNRMGAAIIVASVAAATLGLYLYTFQPSGVTSARHLLMLVLAVAVPVLVAKFYLPFVLPDESRRFLAYLLPLAAAPMMVASLLEGRLAVVLTGVLAGLVVFTGVYLPDLSAVEALGTLDVLRLLAVFGFASVVGIFVVHRAERLNRHLLAGAALAVAAFLLLFSVWLLDADREAGDLPWMTAAAAVNGSLSSLLALGGFLSLGLLFGITTRVQLMELAQLNQPLLRRLQDEAPGTFHHSVIVGNLAERAAQIVGADWLLVRVGCYYHDVGKLLQPAFYIENQLAGDNPHDKLDSQSSAQIVQEHVKGGLELAQQHGLPPRVAAFISEHHGTRLVTYFYRQAARENPRVDATDYRYPGPKPQSRETAIVMLADSVEAVVRSSPDHSAERIDALVDEVIAERLAEGQLDESDLTLREIKTIAESFKVTLKGVYHPRIEYPAPTEVERQVVGRRPVVRLPFRSPRESAGPESRGGKERARRSPLPPE
jgi:putative nucleotidyltransferase with HDIG domain